MRHFILILTISLFASSCGQSDNKEKELALKEKELALKQKELELQEKQLQSESTKTEVDKPNGNIPSLSGQYVVAVDKSYFFNSADVQTKRKGYLLKNEIVEIQKTSGDFVYAVYTSSAGSQTTGWMLLSELQKNTNAPINTASATLAEIYQANNKIFSGYTDKIFTDPRLLARMKKLLGKKTFDDFVLRNIWGFKGDEVNSSYFYTYYNSCPKSCGTYGVIYGDLNTNSLIVGYIDMDIKWFKENKNQALPQKLKDWLKATQNNTLE